MQDQNNAKQLVVERLRQATNVLVTVENNPSVDELAAALALALYLNKLEKHATSVFSGTVPPAINFLEPNKTFEHNLDSLRDFIIALDKDKADRLRYKVEDDVVKVFITPYRTPITQKDLQFSQGDFNIELIVALGVQKQESLDKAITAHGRILHDATVVTINARPEPSALGSVDWQNAQASSISEMVAELAEAIQPNTVDQQIGTALLTGIVAATDRFSNEHTSPHVMNVAAQLMAAGANQKLIAENLQKTLQASKQAGAAAAVAMPKSDDSGKINKSGSPDQQELPKEEGKEEPKDELKLGHKRKKEEPKDKPAEKPEEKKEESKEEPPKNEDTPSEGEKPPMPPPPPGEGGEDAAPQEEVPAEPAPENQPEPPAAAEENQPDVPTNSDQALAQAVESAASLPTPPQEALPTEPQPAESPADSAPADMPTPAAPEEPEAPAAEAEEAPEQELPQNILPGELPQITPLSTHSSANRALEPPKMGGTLSATTAEAEEAKRLEEEARRNQTLLSHSAPVQPSIEAPGVESAASSAMPQGGGFVSQDQPPVSPVASAPPAQPSANAEAELEAARRAVDDALNGQMTATEAQTDITPSPTPTEPMATPTEQLAPAPMPAPAPQQGLPPMPDLGALPPPPPLPPLPEASPVTQQPQPAMPSAAPAQPPQMPALPEQQSIAAPAPSLAPLPPTQPQTAAPAPGQVISDPNDPNQFRIPGQ